MGEPNGSHLNLVVPGRGRGKAIHAVEFVGFRPQGTYEMQPRCGSFGLIGVEEVYHGTPTCKRCLSLLRRV